MIRSPLAHKFCLTSTWLLFIFQIFFIKAMAMQIEQPEYYLKLDMHSFPRTLVINGVIIEKDLSGRGSSSSQFPINHWIKKGENTLELHYGPEKFIKKRTNEHSRCGVSVWVKGKVEGKTVKHKIADLTYTPNYDIPLNERYKDSMPAGHYIYNVESPKTTSEKGDFVIGEIKADSDKFAQKGNRIYRTFTADVPFPEWSFFSADKIFEYPMTSEKFADMNVKTWPMVVELWDLIETKKMDKILPLFETRSKELDIAFYREPGYSIESFEHDLKNVFDKGYPLDRLESNKMQLVVSYNEKLVTKVNAGSGNGTLLFYDKTDNTYTFFNVVWMKKDGKWIIIR